MKKLNQRPYSYLILSLLFHGLWLWLISLNFSLPTEDSSSTKFVEIEYISQEELQQIVEQDQKSINESEPEKASYLSAKNQSVKEETKAANTGRFNNQIQIAKSSSSSNKQTKKALPKLKDLTPDTGWFAEKEEQQKSADSQVSQMARSSDYLKDVKEGAQTILNTREYKYYSYYTRIRRQLQSYWEPSIKKKFLHLLKQGRAPASREDKKTRVLITLNQQGNLMKVQLLEESGVRDLDDAAIEAFQDAAPFPNPPEGIMETDGTVKIRWDFVVEA